MSRELSSAMLAAITAKTVRPISFVHIDFVGGHLRLHSDKGDIEFGGETYTGIGTLTAFSEIEESVDESSNTATLSLTASSSEISLALTEPYHWRPVKIYEGALDLDTGELIEDPVEEYSGFISTMNHKDDGKNTIITVECVDETGDQERVLIESYTDEDQKRLHPDDKGFEFVTVLPGQEITWGNGAVKAAITPPATGGEPYPDVE